MHPTHCTQSIVIAIKTKVPPQDPQGRDAYCRRIDAGGALVLRLPSSLPVGDGAAQLRIALVAPEPVDGDNDDGNDGDAAAAAVGELELGVVSGAAGVDGARGTKTLAAIFAGGAPPTSSLSSLFSADAAVPISDLAPPGTERFDGVVLSRRSDGDGEGGVEGSVDRIVVVCLETVAVIGGPGA